MTSNTCVSDFPSGTFLTFDRQIHVYYRHDTRTRAERLSLQSTRERSQDKSWFAFFRACARSNARARDNTRDNTRDSTRDNTRDNAHPE